MEFTTTEFEQMRSELRCNGFNALVRHLPGSKREIYQQIADYLGISYGLVANFVSRPASKKHSDKLSEFALENGVLMYPYQFYPTDEVCQNWLEFAYRCDKGAHSSKWVFTFWERNMSGLRVTKEAA